MVDVVRFFEKPGCKTNRQQKKLLQAAGYILQEESLLNWPWQAQELYEYLQQVPSTQWFNRTAPRITSGELVPETLTEQQALAAMLQDPLLIRRPLLEFKGKKMVGFDQDELMDRLGIMLQPQTTENLEACSGHQQRPCPMPAAGEPA